MRAGNFFKKLAGFLFPAIPMALAPIRYTAKDREEFKLTWW